MNVNTPASKSQQRAAKLLGIEIRDSYAYASETLEAAGISREGIPAGHSWRSAAKLADADLVALLTAAPEMDVQWTPDGR